MIIGSHSLNECYDVLVPSSYKKKKNLSNSKLIKQTKPIDCRKLMFY
jgi:hypothetical protein